MSARAPPPVNPRISSSSRMARIWTLRCGLAWRGARASMALTTASALRVRSPPEAHRGLQSPGRAVAADRGARLHRTAHWHQRPRQRALAGWSTTPEPGAATAQRAGRHASRRRRSWAASAPPLRRPGRSTGRRTPSQSTGRQSARRPRGHAPSTRGPARPGRPCAGRPGRRHRPTTQRWRSRRARTPGRAGPRCVRRCAHRARWSPRATAAMPPVTCSLR